MNTEKNYLCPTRLFTACCFTLIVDVDLVNVRLMDVCVAGGNGRLHLPAVLAVKPFRVKAVKLKQHNNLPAHLTLAYMNAVALQPSKLPARCQVLVFSKAGGFLDLTL